MAVQVTLAPSRCGLGKLGLSVMVTGAAGFAVVVLCARPTPDSRLSAIKVIAPTQNGLDKAHLRCVHDGRHKPTLLLSDDLVKRRLDSGQDYQLATPKVLTLYTNPLRPRPLSKFWVVGCFE